jgi:hypothetical protein
MRVWAQMTPGVGDGQNDGDQAADTKERVQDIFHFQVGSVVGFVWLVHVTIRLKFPHQVGHGVNGTGFGAGHGIVDEVVDITGK